MFSAAKRPQFWAWAVWWFSGKASGVELNFRDAKSKADDTIRQVESRIPEGHHE